MIESPLLAACLNSLKDSFMFVDTNHVICYMNQAAIDHYAKYGGVKLLGSSLLDCHNEESCRQIVNVLEDMLKGLDERLISVNEQTRTYMRAVRNESGHLVGYYERYEPIVK